MEVNGQDGVLLRQLTSVVENLDTHEAAIHNPPPKVVVTHS